MEGFYDPSQASPLAVNAKLEKHEYQNHRAVYAWNFSNMDGLLTGNYEITGTFLEPLIRGDGKIQSAQLTIDYLKTTY